MLNIVLFVFILEWFLIHVVPTVYFGDCGEILSAVYSNGIPHPTGFPLYLLLAAPMAKLGTSPFYVHLVLALSSTMTAFLFLSVYRRLRGLDFGHKLSPPFQVMGLFIFLSSSTLLLHSSVARVYALNLSCLFLALSWIFEDPQAGRRSFLGLGACIGLGIASHGLFIILLPALVIWYWNRRKGMAAKAPFILTGFCLAASLFLWLPLRAHLHPAVNWGHPDDIHSLFNYLTMKNFQNKVAARDFQDTFLFLKSLLGWAYHEWPLFLWPLAAVGLWRGFQKKKILFWFSIIFLLSNIGILFLYGNESDLYIGYRYFLPCYALLSFWALMGTEWIWERIKSFPFFKLPVMPWLLVFLFFLLFFHHQKKWKELNRSLLCHDYAVDLLKPIPRNAALEITGDNQAFPLSYLIYVRHLRSDLKIIDWSEDVFPMTIQRLKQNPSLSPAEIEKEALESSGGQLYLPADRQIPPPLKVEPYGLCYRMTSTTGQKKWPDPPDPRSIFRFRGTGAGLTDIESGEVAAEYPSMEGAYWLAKGDRAKALEQFTLAETMGWDSPHTLLNLAELYRKAGDLDKAETDLRRVLELQPHSFTAHLNLGIVYGQAGQYDISLIYLKKALQLDPRNPLAIYYYNKVRGLLGSGAI